MSFFNRDHHDFHWLAAMLSGAGLLVMAAVFISGGGLSNPGTALAQLGVTPASQTAQFGCGVPGFGCNTTTVFPPLPIYFWACDKYTDSSHPQCQPGSGNHLEQGHTTGTLFWQTGFVSVYGQTGSCWLSGGEFGSNRVVPNGANAPSPMVVQINPNGQNVTYHLHCVEQYETGYAFNDADATVSYCAAGQTVNSAGACVTAAPSEPALTFTADQPSVPYHGNTMLRWSTTNTTSCLVTSGPYQLWTGTNSSGWTGTYAPGGLEGDSTYTLTCQSPAGERSKNLTVQVGAAPVSSCSNGLNVNSYPSCSCPSGQHQSGSSCINDAPTSCSNGLTYGTYGPSCACPADQHQSGASCVADSCSNSLDYDTYGPSCSCPADQHQSGASCVANTCSNNLDYGAYGPSCTCPSGQYQSGSTCTAPGQPTGYIYTDTPAIQVGQSTGVHAIFAAGAGDTLTGTNIDSPEGTGLAQDAGPHAAQNITFTPTAPGTYIFYARVATANYGWQTKDSASIVVSAEPPPRMPQGLSTSCNAAGTSVTASWGRVTGVDHYWVGLDDTANNTSSCQSGWMCVSPPDYSANTTAATKTYTTTPGHALRLMVSSCTASENCSAANEIDFTCNLPQPALSITANGQTGLAQIPVNTPITVAWSSGNVESGSCHVSNNSDDEVVWQEDDSSHTIGTLTATRIYTLYCNKLDGTPATPATVTIGIQPGQIDGPLTANPGRVQQGQQTTLSWHTAGMTDCALTSNTTAGVISSSLASNNTRGTVPQQTTFTLVCHDGTNAFRQSVDVGVIPRVQEQ